MSKLPAQGSPSYQPLALDGEHIQDVFIPYNGPPTPHSDLPSFETQQQDPSLRSLPVDGLPYAPSAPRFLGAALTQEDRHSYASSQNVYAGVYDDHGSSVFALNATRDSSVERAYSYLPYQDDPHDADFRGSSATLGAVPVTPRGRQSRYLEEKRELYVPKRKSKRFVILASLAGLILVAIAVVIAIYFTVIKKNNSNSASNSSAPGSPTGSTSGSGSTVHGNLAVSGGDGSTITMEDGTTFTYSNKFGGTWYYDANDPFNNAAQVNSWTPALNQTFKYGVDRIFGVNIGGWLVTEPFIAPALFEKYYNTTTTPPIDEWTLSQAMAADKAAGGLSQLETHYKTFITEQDFAEIAGAGLNYVRIPIPYWAIEVRAGEPFLPKTAWTYFLKAIQWARKYGLRINLDLHAVPGSQNGWNHSGKLGSINFLNGPMGMANAQRTLDYIRIITEFISQPEYKDVVTMFGVLNEPSGAPTIGQENLSNFYGQVYKTMRSITGTGEGNGPFISLHEGFLGLQNWAGFLTNSDRVAIDTHPYICFGDQSSNPMSSYATTPCDTWGASTNTSMGAFGLTGAGEFSNAVTDCGLWVNGVNQGTRYDGSYVAQTFPSRGSCTPWTDYQNWTQSQKDATKQFALASMDALQNFFFWTWKIGNSSVTGKVEAPSWSYQLGLQNGWMPTDPRSSFGVCGNTSPFQGPLKAWQTGGTGAGTSVSSGTLIWPPKSLSNAGAVALLPTYTPTGTIVTLPVPTFTKSGGGSINAGNGWLNTADNVGLNVPISSCSYLDPWVGPAPPPSPLCTAAAKRGVAAPMITPPP